MNLAPVWAHSDVEPSTPDQPALTNQQLFFPFISTAEQAVGYGHDDYELAEQARQRNEPPFVAPEVQPAAATDLIRIGQWGATVTWPFVFASAASLPDGRIVAWGGNNVSSFNGGNYTYSAVWNPVTGQFLSTPNSNHSMFCGIPTTLEDGRVLVNGGDGNNPHASIFDYRTNQWQRIDEMVNGRWYPGSVALPTGQVFTAIGEGGGQYPEIWTPGQGWALQTGANLQGPILNYTGYQTNWLPYFHLAPNGQIFHSGPTPQMNWINLTGNGSVTAAGLTNTWYPKYSTVVMYEEGKLLMAGGAVDTSSTAAGTNQAALIDINGASAQRTAIAPMTYARKFNSNVILPTGEVMIIGGNTSGTEFSDNGTILTPELWNPDTKAWRTVADMGVPRNYHSVALLMPDGRVWSGGGGLCACAADHPNAQIYSPPYLFNAAGGAATRPAITAAPDIVITGRTFTVQASAGIQKFSLIKISAVTHDLNSDLRYLRVPFTSVTNGQYQLTMHSNRNVLTPGYWMLFAVDSQGVPSVAKIIQVVTSGAPRITNLGAQSTAVNTAVNLPVSAVSVTGNPLTYSATGLPNGLAINSSTGVIAGTVTTVGLFHVAVTVNDGGNNASNFDWTVYQPGATRYVKLVALSEVAGNPWASAAEVNVLDSQGNALSRTGWTITADSAEPTGEGGHPAAYAIDGNASTFWHTPWVATTPAYPHSLTINLGATYTIGGFRYLPRQDASANGTVASYQIFASTDGVNWGQPVAQGTWANNKTEKTVILPVNRAPVLTTPTNQTNLVGNTVTLPISATDPDGDPLTYSATGLPAGLAINSTGVIAGTVNTAGTFGVAVTANDGKGGIATGNFTWTVSQPSFTLNPMFSPPKPVNTAVNYTASISNGVNPRVKWLFGDGSAETAYATTPTTSHTFTQPGIYVVKLTATDDSGREQSLTFTQAIHLPPTANRPAVSMNIVYEARANANGRIWVVNQDNDTVSVFDAVTNGKLAEIGVGKAPRSLAIAPNGRVWVTNKGAATISLIDPNTLAVVQTLNLPYAAQPFGIIFSPTGTAAYVALEASGLVVRFDPNTATQTGSLNVGVNVRQLAVSADGSKLYVSRFITPRVPGEETATPQMANGGAEIVLVDTASLSVRKTIILRYSDKPDTEVQGRGLPNYLGPVVIAPDGVNGWTPSKQDNILRGALRDGNNLNFQNTVRAIASHLDLTNDVEDYATRMDLDNAGVANTALFDKSGSYLFVALETNRQVAVIDAYGRRELFRMDVGRAPQGLALSADGLKLYVNNFMDRTITALDISKVINEGKNIAPTLATYPSVTTEKLAATVLKGKQFFYDAKDPRLARDSYISCAACHNDGGQDGRVWDLTGMGEGLRNTIALNGRAGMGQGLLHWSGNFDEVQDFEGQIRTLAGGAGLLTDADFTATQNSLGAPKAGKSADLDALAAYVNGLTTFAASPYRNGDGTLTADALAGKTIFQNANCAQCHAGIPFTDSATNNLRNIGTIKPSSGNRLGGPLTGIDTPTLRDVWATAPYLHNGSAATLADAVRAHQGTTLNDSDLTKLLAFVNQIGSEEAQAPVALGSGQILREWWTGLSGSLVTDLTNNAKYPYQPSGSNQLTSFEAPSNWADNYGTRLRGYLSAPVTGSYTFWIASDDYGQLLLSTDANPANAAVIANVPGWTNAREWTKYSQQKSIAITLQAGQKYYIEVQQKEGTGSDNLAVAWQIPGGAQSVIAGQYLSPYQPPTVTNLAQGKAAKQSSTYASSMNPVANKAVDGNTNSNFSGGSVSSTNADANAWWQVDLGATYTLDTIRLWNRTDCCSDRLANFTVFVATTDLTGRSFTAIKNDSTVWRYTSTGQTPATLNIPAYVKGRYVRVQLAGTNYLSLAEVQVFGK